MKKLQKIKLTQAKDFAKQVAKQLKGGEILALVGPLGAGKTTFAKALGKHLKVKENMPSPTFTLMHCFPAKLTKPSGQTIPVNLFHLDLYRLDGFKEVKALGITDEWKNKNNITLIEWADKIKRHLPANTYVIEFEH